MIESIDREFTESALRLSRIKSDIFVELSNAAGLDKGTDFIGANLRDVDFSNSDLSGFDFSYADLRGSYGVAVKIDKNSTKLNNALTNDSIFSHLNYNANMTPAEVVKFNSVNGKYWPDKCVWIHENIMKKPSKEAKKIAISLFLEERNFNSKDGNNSAHETFI